nr:MAG TPA: hypothetical protein [Caudoviricetes sp.]
MDAYEKDGILERCLKGSMDWEQIVEPVWNWEKYVYRIIPKKRKFEEGDKVIEKDAQMLSLEGENNNYIWTVKGYTQEGKVEFKGGAIMPENQVCEEYVKIDDALWYWEYRDENGKWKMTFERSTVDGLNLNVTDAYCELSTATPIYALGFRLPDD